MLKSTVKDKKKRKRVKGSGGGKIYKDADEDGWASDDKGFIASSSSDQDGDGDDQEADHDDNNNNNSNNNDDAMDIADEKLGVQVQKAIRDYVRSEGTKHALYYDFGACIESRLRLE